MKTGHSGFGLPDGATYGFHGHGAGFVDDDRDMIGFGKHSVWEVTGVSDENMKILKTLIDQAKANKTKKSFGPNPEDYPVLYSIIPGTRIPMGSPLAERMTRKPPYPTCHGQTAYFVHTGRPDFSLGAGQLANTLEEALMALPGSWLVEMGPNFYVPDTTKLEELPVGPSRRVSDLNLEGM